MTDQQTGPPQAPPPQRSSRAPIFIVLGIVFACGALVVMCALAIFVFSLFGGGTETWEYTHEQKRVLAEFGPPETFTLIYVSELPTGTAGDEESPVVRMETWEYPTLGAAFAFRNGEFLRRWRVAIPDVPLEYPALRPDLFVAGMEADDVSNLLDDEPDTVATLFPEAFEGLETHEWAGQLAVGFQDGGLVTVETFPVLAGGEQ